jgi:hypothetical protein
MESISKNPLISTHSLLQKGLKRDLCPREVTAGLHNFKEPPFCDPKSSLISSDTQSLQRHFQVILRKQTNNQLDGTLFSYS